MKIVHLTSVHPRYDTRIFLKECCSLAAAGHEVALVVADGYGDELRDGVQIYDVGAPRNRLNRVLDIVSRIYERAVALDGDAFHLHDPELLRISLRLKRSGFDKHVIYDAHEDLPRQILSKHWIPAVLRWFASFTAELVENYVTRRLSGIVAATPHIADRFRKLNVCTVNVNNYPIPDELKSIENGELRRKKQICYVGSITRVRGVESIIRALPLIPDVELVLCGLFSEREFETEMRSLPGWAQVDYRGQVGRAEVRQVLSESMAGMVTLMPTSAYLESLPIKMFEYMAAQLPVIASDFPLWRKILQEAGAGVCVDPLAPEAIARQVLSLLGDADAIERFGIAGRKAVVDKYNWPNEPEKLSNFYEKFE